MKPQLIRGTHYTIDHDGDVQGEDWEIYRSFDNFDQATCWVWVEQANTVERCPLKRGIYPTRREALEAVRKYFARGE